MSNLVISDQIEFKNIIDERNYYSFVNAQRKS